VSESSDTRHKPVRIGLLGASFDTGNMGVSALAESSIKLILNRWPEAEIILLGSGHIPGQYCLTLSGKEICFQTLPIRFSKNILLPCHFLRFVLDALLTKLLHASRLKDALVNRNQHFKLLFETDLVADITAGDSFSDIYGFRRFFLGFLCKWLVIFLGKKLVLLPQTYGPFKGLLTRKMARYILNKAAVVYSRDRAGVEYVRKALNINTDAGKIRSVPDVAFVLDARKPDNLDVASLSEICQANTPVVGLNISGLLFNQAHTMKDAFGLKVNYQDLMHKIVKLFVEEEKTRLILIPHVFPQRGLEVENDFYACKNVYEQVPDKDKNRIMLVETRHNHNELKYIIGLCSFFIGSRMHACIAAISQNVPAIGLAYSNKFEGVFEQVGIGELAIDLRAETEDTILSRIRQAFARRDTTAQELSMRVPKAQKEVLSIFDGVCELR
jgi:polysaccharide pyruvyl transferase WcaK-like protein